MKRPCLGLFAAVTPFLLALVALAGCSQQEKLCRVSGVVTHAGKPIPKGLIFFDPKADGPQGFANIVDGKYDTAVQGKGVRGASLSVSMPAWSPGMYRIENYARNVQDFRAANTRNQSLKWEKTDKQTWLITKTDADDVVVDYRVYSAALADDIADVAPPTLFMYVVGQKHVPCTLRYNAPAGWNGYTGLEKRGVSGVRRRLGCA